MAFKVSWRSQLLMFLFILKQVKVIHMFYIFPSLPIVTNEQVWLDFVQFSKIIMNSSVEKWVISEVVFFVCIWPKWFELLETLPGLVNGSQRTIQILQRFNSNFFPPTTGKIVAKPEKALSVILVFINIPDHFRAKIPPRDLPWI